MLASTELETAGVEETRLKSVVDAGESLSDTVAVADWREEAEIVGSCERSEASSSWRRTAGWDAAVTACKQRINAMHTRRKR